MRKDQMNYRCFEARLKARNQERIIQEEKAGALRDLGKFVLQAEFVSAGLIGALMLFIYNEGLSKASENDGSSLLPILFSVFLVIIVSLICSLYNATSTHVELMKSFSNRKLYDEDRNKKSARLIMKPFFGEVAPGSLAIVQAFYFFVVTKLIVIALIFFWFCSIQ